MLPVLTDSHSGGQATQPYYTPKTGAVDEEDNATGSVSAPKADQPMAPEDLVEIDQVLDNTPMRLFLICTGSHLRDLRQRGE